MKIPQNLLPYVLSVFSELLDLLHLLLLLCLDLGALTVNLPARAVHHPLVLLHGLYIARLKKALGTFRVHLDLLVPHVF